MMKKWIWSSICLLLASGSYAQEGVRFFGGTLEEALQEARAQKKMLFIDAYTSWCGPCRWMSESEFTKPYAGAFFNKHFVNFKIDVEKGDGPAFAEKYAIHGYPTFVVLNSDGSLRHRVLGADTLHLFIPMVEKGLNRKTSYGYLQEKYRQGTLTKKELPQAIEVFRNAGMKKEVGSLCDSLYRLLSEKERLDGRYWIVYQLLSYNDLLSERLKFLVTHTAIVAGGAKQTEAWEVVRTQLTDHLYNNTAGQITHKENPWNLGVADEMPVIRALLEVSDLPDRAFLTDWCALATACYYEQAEQVPFLLEKVVAYPQAREYRYCFVSALKRLCPEQQEMLGRLQEEWDME